MKAVRIHEYGGHEALVYEDAPRPQPKEGEVLVQVRAASMNPVDWKVRAGYMRQWVDLPLPTTMGRDFAGDIVEVGPGVTGFQVGDAVFGNVPLGTGTHAEYVTAAAGDIIRKPANLDYEAAAATPLAALAAWQGLHDNIKLQPGQRILIHAGAGGVGHFAVQFAHLLGAHVITTASSDNADFLRELGADQVVDYKSTRFEDVAQNMDAVLDTVGGETQDRSWAVLKPGGVLATLYGFAPGAVDGPTAQGLRAEMVSAHPDGTHLAEIAKLIEEGKVRPVVTQVLPLHEAQKAHQLSENGHLRGKLVLRVGQS